MSGLGYRASGFGRIIFFQADITSAFLEKASGSAEARWLKPEVRPILALFREKSWESTLAVAKL
jgi:hypothetical protein